MAAENGREIVLDMLLAIDREEAFSHVIIKDVLDKYDYLPAQEKAFMKRLFEGTLERRIELDYRINQVSKVPVNKMKPLIRNLLRMSAYQLFYMDSVPDSAAVNEAVKLANKRKFQNLKGFVNGVLRNLAKQKEADVLPSQEKQPGAYLSVQFSMPEWIVEHFLFEYSYEQTKQILEGLMEIRPVTIRFAHRLTDEEKQALISSMEEKGVTVRQHSEAAGAYELVNCENLAELPGFTEGAFTVQDVSSMLAVETAQIKEGDFVLDVCAAPGGKSMLAAEFAGESGHVEARDVSASKVAIIEENRDRMQLSNLSVQVWDGTVPDETMEEKADVVLADVPCSGLGVMGKKRDIKYRQKPENIEHIIQLQREILTQAVKYVKKGGVLLYSTCTINRAENEEQAGWICKEFGFTGETERQLLPGENGTDGFFYARLRKM